MKHGRWALAALLLASLAWGRQAAAVDDADIRQLATFSGEQFFLETHCGLVPSEGHKQTFGDKYYELAQTQEVEGDNSYQKWEEEMTNVVEKYATLSLELPKEELCEQLESEFVAAGGELVEKPAGRN